MSSKVQKPKHEICPVLDTGNFTISCNSGHPRNVAPGYQGPLSPCALWNANVGHCALAALAPAPAATPTAAKEGFWKRLFRPS